MHPILFKIGDFPFGTYGLFVVMGFFCAMALAMHLAKRQGLSAEAISDLVIVMLLAGILGSRLLMIIVDLVSGAVQFGDIFSLGYLRAGGAIHGGIIAGTAAFFWRMRKWKLPLEPTMEVFAPAIPLGQAIGRLGCFFAGCCYGTECHLPWAVTFTDPNAWVLSGTRLNVPLHPVQLYTALAGFLVAGLLLLLRKFRRYPAQVAVGYFLLEGVARIILETWRGDGLRGTGWLGLEWLSTGRVTGFVFILFGLGMWWWFGRKHARDDASAT